MAKARHQTLTPFTGVPFDEDHPYSPSKAKRFLTQVMEEVRQSDRLREFGADSLAHYKLPEAVRIVDELPRNASDKTDRRALAAVETDRSST